MTDTPNHNAEMGPKPGEPNLAPSPQMSALKARYMAEHRFSTIGEMRRMFMFVLLGLGGLAVFLQFHWNKVKMQEDLQRDQEEWAKRQEAIKAPPQPGVAPVGGAVKWDNMLAEERDDASLDDIATDKGFQYLVRHLSNLKPGEGIKPEERFDYVDLLKNPALHRGNVVSLSGLVNKVYSNIRLESNQGSFDSVYRLYLVDLSGTEGCIVDVLERPDGIDERVAVEADAIFVRTNKYEAVDKKNGAVGKMVRVPYFLARKVSRIQRSNSPSMWSTKVTVIVVGVCAVLVLVIFLAGRTDRPKQKTIQPPENSL